jgi:cytochrome c-type biogenesis protein CcmH/NrfG
MTVFWIAVALITAGALLWVVSPLWQGGGGTARREAAAVAVFIPFVAVGVTALRLAVEQRPGDATLLADLADVIALTRGRHLVGEPAALVQRALDAGPRHPKALSLAGSVAFEARDYAAASGYWERLLPLLRPDSEGARSVRGSIAQALALQTAAGASPAQNAGPTGVDR